MIENSRFDTKQMNKNIANSMLPPDTIKENRDMIRDYLNNIDLKFRIEHPIPGKGPKYISRDTEF